MNNKQGWIGVDLDGTLAEYNTGEYHPNEIGKPVERMLNRVKKWIVENKDVRIFTARVSPYNTDHMNQELLIRAWCMKHLGRALPVTCCKDYMMIELWDDRAIQVESNTGRRVDGKT